MTIESIRPRTPTEYPFSLAHRRISAGLSRGCSPLLGETTDQKGFASRWNWQPYCQAAALARRRAEVASLAAGSPARWKEQSSSALAVLRSTAPKASSATTPTPTPNRRRGVTANSRCRQLAINRSMNGKPNRVKEPRALIPTRPSTRASAPAVAPPPRYERAGREERRCDLRST